MNINPTIHAATPSAANRATVSGASSVAKSKPKGTPGFAAVTERNIRNIASKNAKSPTRLTMNALLAAAEFLRSRYQYPMSRYEHSPTPSHPRNRTTRLSASTRLSIAKMNRFRYGKNRQNPSSSCMYPIEYRWMRLPMPVTISVISSESWSIR